MPLPPKPKPKYSERIRNSGGGIQGDMGSAMRYQDNMTHGVQLAGFGYGPSLAVHSFVLLFLGRVVVLKRF